VHSHAEISQLANTFACHQHVGTFDVPMADIVPMQVLYPKQNLSRVPVVLRDVISVATEFIVRAFYPKRNLSSVPAALRDVSSVMVRAFYPEHHLSCAPVAASAGIVQARHGKSATGLGVGSNLKGCDALPLLAAKPPSNRSRGWEQLKRV
jgi:hypothetical protein